MGQGRHGLEYRCLAVLRVQSNVPDVVEHRQDEPAYKEWTPLLPELRRKDGQGR